MAREVSRLGLGCFWERRIWRSHQALRDENLHFWGREAPGLWAHPSLAVPAPWDPWAPLGSLGCLVFHPGAMLEMQGRLREELGLPVPAWLLVPMIYGALWAAPGLGAAAQGPHPAPVRALGGTNPFPPALLGAGPGPAAPLPSLGAHNASRETTTSHPGMTSRHRGTIPSVSSSVRQDGKQSWDPHPALGLPSQGNQLGKCCLGLGRPLGSIPLQQLPGAAGTGLG